MKKYQTSDGQSVADLEVLIGGVCLFRMPVKVDLGEENISFVEAMALLRGGGHKPELPEKEIKREFVLREVLDLNFLDIGDKVCRRDGGGHFTVMPTRRVRDSMLTVEQIATRTRSGAMAYFCRDFSGKLHFINAHEVRRVAS